jgi:hypothetical protein
MGTSHDIIFHAIQLWTSAPPTLNSKCYMNGPAYPCPLERSVPANLRTDCRTPFRARIYDACMARFWRNAGIYYTGSALPYFRLFDWPPLVLVEEACVNEAMGVLSQ